MNIFPEKPRILLADDELTNLRTLAATLEPFAEIVIARRSSEAIERAMAAPPDLILLDINMPEMDGYEACRRIKENEQLRHIPVIFITALDAEEDESKGFEAGAVDYITKPFSPAIVTARVKTHVELKRHRDLEQQARRELEAELRLASRMQRDLLPREMPQVPGYSFYTHLAQCRLAGGDLYDAGILPGGRVFLLEADVSGKGMGAALLASNILASFRILRDQEAFEPSDALRRVSRQLLASSRQGDFATLFLGLLDPVGHRVVYFNAGHPPPLLMSARGAPRSLESGELPIGILGDCSWTPHTVDLEPGDGLLVYTDGLPDAENAEGQTFSAEGIASFAAAHRHLRGEAFAQGLIDEARRFSGVTAPSDDLTLIGMFRDP